MDMLADLIRELYVEHAASFRCPDPSRVDGRMRAATVNGLSASLFRYDGFAYSARLEPMSAPMALVCVRGSGEFTFGRDYLSMAPGRACLPPSGRPCEATGFTGEYATLQVPWDALRSLAEEAGVPGGALRFASKAAPVSAARERTFFKTVEFICRQLVTSGTTEISPLIAREMTRLAAAAFLETFPNTTMTDPYLADPGWVVPTAVRRATAFIDEHADRPVTTAEIAAAAGVNVQALKYAFHRHYDTTVQRYLRRVRLERAHLELRNAEPGEGVTVAGVARKWGWTSPARFAETYRQRFAVSPGWSLRT
jgi:AraC-like DNA-binding protein